MSTYEDLQAQMALLQQSITEAALERDAARTKRIDETFAGAEKLQVKDGAVTFLVTDVGSAASIFELARALGGSLLVECDDKQWTVTFRYTE